MPEYYSLGSLSLSIGTFIESFPNVSLESLACETPSISSRVGAHRFILPEVIEPKIDVGDITTLVDLAYQILLGNVNTKKAREYIIYNFNYKTMLQEYENMIINCKRRTKLPLKFRNKNNLLTIPPWAYLSQRGLYNDYQYKYDNDPQLIHLFKDRERAKEEEFTPENLVSHLQKGNLIRMSKE